MHLYTVFVIVAIAAVNGVPTVPDPNSSSPAERTSFVKQASSHESTRTQESQHEAQRTESENTSEQQKSKSFGQQKPGGLLSLGGSKTTKVTKTEKKLNEKEVDRQHSTQTDRDASSSSHRTSGPGGTSGGSQSSVDETSVTEDQYRERELNKESDVTTTQEKKQFGLGLGKLISLNTEETQTKTDEQNSESERELSRNSTAVDQKSSRDSTAYGSDRNGSFLNETRADSESHRRSTSQNEQLRQENASSETVTKDRKTSLTVLGIKLEKDKSETIKKGPDGKVEKSSKNKVDNNLLKRLPILRKLGH